MRTHACCRERDFIIEKFTVEINMQGDFNQNACNVIDLYQKQYR